MDTGRSRRGDYQSHTGCHVKPFDRVWHTGSPARWYSQKDIQSNSLEPQEASSHPPPPSHSQEHTSYLLAVALPTTPSQRAKGSAAEGLALLSAPFLRALFILSQQLTEPLPGSINSGDLRGHSQVSH